MACFTLSLNPICKLCLIHEWKIMSYLRGTSCKTHFILSQLLKKIKNSEVCECACWCIMIIKVQQSYLWKFYDLQSFMWLSLSMNDIIEVKTLPLIKSSRSWNFLCNSKTSRSQYGINQSLLFIVKTGRYIGGLFVKFSFKGNWKKNNYTQFNNNTKALKFYIVTLPWANNIKFSK